jgi:hypothetical protein
MAWGDSTGPIESWQQKRDREGRNISWEFDQSERRIGEQADTALGEARSGETSVAKHQLAQGLGQARRGQASQSIGRGSNALAQRAAMYSGGDQYGRANAGAASLRAQEMNAARSMAADAARQQGEMGLQERALWQQQVAQQQANELARDQFAADESQRSWDRANQVVGTMANMGSAATMASDERLKMNIDDPRRMRAVEEDSERWIQTGDDKYLESGRSWMRDVQGSDDPRYDQAKEILRRDTERAQPPPQAAPPTETAPWWMYRQGSSDGTRTDETIRNVAGSFQTGAQMRQQALGTKGEDKYEQLFGGGSPEAGGLSSLMSDYRSKTLSDYRSKTDTAQRVAELSQQYEAEDAKTTSRLGLGQRDDRVSRLSALLDAEGAKTDARLREPSPRGPADEEAARVSAELDREADETMRRLQAHRYQYRPEAQAEGAPPGDRAGIMAQDLESTPLGRDAVIEDERGVKYLDVPQTTSITAGLVGRAGRRIDDLEERLRRLEGGR